MLVKYRFRTGRLRNLLRGAKTIDLAGPPGTGKTLTAAAPQMTFKVDPER